MPQWSAGTRRFKPADVRFYLDADVLGLAKLLVQVRNDVTYPGDPGGVVQKRERPGLRHHRPRHVGRGLDT